MSHFLPDMKNQLFSGDTLQKLGGYNSQSVFEEHWNQCDSQHPLSRVQYLDIKTFLADGILTKVDRASMAVSLEVRVPLLDHRFVEFAATLPAEWKLSGKVGKFILKRSLGRLLPPATFTRPKAGFNLPIGEWFRGPLKDFAHDKLMGGRGIASTGLFRPKTIESLWRSHQSGIRNHSQPLFALLSFALWYDKFQNGAPNLGP
jgi:asparagine synthase (glutamine-hydrolysing)